MNILYDDEIFFRQRFGGVSRIFSELIKYIETTTTHRLHFHSGYSENEYLLGIRNNTPSFLRHYNFPLKGKLIRGVYGNYSHSRINRILKSNSMDVFHPTFYSDYYLNSLKQSGTRLVFTVHDLIHEQTVDNTHYANIAKAKARNLKVADQVITVSENTKRDLLRIYPFLDEKKINVIHLAQSLPEHGVRPKNFPERYILFTGERGGYKNFDTLLQSFVSIQKKYPDLTLFCAGSSSFNLSEQQQINSLGLSEHVVQHRLTDEELSYAYQHAEVFVFPSLYEGFGIPVLEAFYAGTPAVISNKASLPEVGGDAALYMDASSHVSMTDAILLTLEDASLRKQLVNKGKARITQFSWEQHAKKTLEVYAAAL
jgi:glycosyltransferase involved in cell wall biosynthesis